MSNPINVGVDDGFAAIKVVYRNGHGLEQHQFPSRAMYGLDGATDMSGASVGGYSADGQDFTVGVAGLTDPIETRFDDYSTSPLNRVLVHHALHASGLGGRACRVASGLPFTTFYNEPERRKSKTDSLHQQVTKAGGAELASIGQQSVFPQGAIAWIDTAISDTGEVVAALDAPVAIVDIGGNTTDIAVMLDGQLIDRERSGTEELGVLHLADTLKQMIQQSLKVKATDAAIDAALRTRTLRLWGEDQDIGELVDNAVKAMSSRIAGAVSRRVGDGSDLEKILMVGGGAALMSEGLQTYPHLSVVDHPAFANARGMWKYLEFVDTNDA